jgi:hypothetical protein
MSFGLVQPILSEAICPFLLHDDLPRFCNMLVGDLECVRVELERSPHTYFCTCFLFKKKQRKQNKQGLYQLKYWGA